VDPRFSGFEDVWKTWRPHDKRQWSVKKVARQVYETIVRAGADPQRIVDGVRAHCSNPEKTKEGGKYLGKLCKFLETEAWDDLADDVQAERAAWLQLFAETGEWNESKLGPKPKEGRSA
jgi:hypothetical protein